MVTKEDFEKMWSRVNSDIKSIMLTTNDKIRANRFECYENTVILYRQEYAVANLKYQSIEKIEGD